MPLALVHAATEAEADAADARRSGRLSAWRDDGARRAAADPSSGSPDAARLPDRDGLGRLRRRARCRRLSATPGANTLGHIAAACAAGRAEEGRSGPLQLPHLDALGLGAAIRLASGCDAPGLDADAAGRWGAATEVSRGKDTPSGHWELAGVPVPWDWTYFPDTDPGLSAAIWWPRSARWPARDGILGNCHASGMPIIERAWRRASADRLADLLHLGRLACSRSPRMKRPSGWTGC